MLNLKPLCRAIVDVASPIPVGKTPAGLRSIGAFRSAEVTGDRLKATLAGPAAADWIRVNGRVGEIDVRLTLATDDGAFVHMEYTGKLLLAREGGPMAVVAARFEAGDERYAWLNEIQAIGRGTLGAGTDGGSVLTYDFYEVL